MCLTAIVVYHLQHAKDPLLRWIEFSVGDFDTFRDGKWHLHALSPKTSPIKHQKGHFYVLVSGARNLPFLRVSLAHCAHKCIKQVKYPFPCFWITHNFSSQTRTNRQSSSSLITQKCSLSTCVSIWLWIVAKTLHNKMQILQRKNTTMVHQWLFPVFQFVFSNLGDSTITLICCNVHRNLGLVGTSQCQLIQVLCNIKSNLCWMLHWKVY